MSRLVNRNILAGPSRTSMRLEPEMWDALGEICRRESLTLAEMLRRIDTKGAADSAKGGRTSGVRVFIVQYFRNLAQAGPLADRAADHPASACNYAEPAGQPKHLASPSIWR